MEIIYGVQCCYNLRKNSLFLKNLKKHFRNLIYKKNFVKHVNSPPHLSEKWMGDNLLISLSEIEIYRLLVSPKAFLRLSIIVITLVHKGLSCPSLVILQFCW